MAAGRVSTLQEWDEYEWAWTGSLVDWALHEAVTGDDRQQALDEAREHRRGWLHGYRRPTGCTSTPGWLVGMTRPCRALGEALAAPRSGDRLVVTALFRLAPSTP